MAKKSESSEKRRVGRPRGSTRGPTMVTTLRLPVALRAKIARIQRQGDVLLSQSQALEKALRRGIASIEADATTAKTSYMRASAGTTTSGEAPMSCSACSGSP